MNVRKALVGALLSSAQAAWRASLRHVVTLKSTSLRRPTVWSTCLRLVRATCGRRVTGDGITAITYGRKAAGSMSATAIIGFTTSGFMTAGVGVSRQAIGIDGSRLDL